MIQKDRIYALTIGDYKNGNGIRITELQVRFNVSKSADQKRKPAGATIEVYNLSKSSIQLLNRDYVEAKLEVGYVSTGLHTIVSGNVKEVSTRDRGVDMVTTILIGEAYSDLQQTRTGGTLPAGRTGEDLLEMVRGTMPGVAKGAYTGQGVKKTLPYGYPLNGSPKEVLDAFCEANQLEWRVDNGALYVTDEAGLVNKNKALAPIISPSTGLVGIPFRRTEKGKKAKDSKTRRSGVQFNALLKPELVPGALIYLESVDIKGWYKITDIQMQGDYRGNDWYSSCFCSLVDDGDIV